MPEPRSGPGTLLTGELAALLASTCCLGPLVLVGPGFSGVWIGNLTLLEPYWLIFLGAALVAMFFAWRRIWRPLENCKLGEVCAIPKFELREAAVTFDNAKASVQKLTQATTNAGYPSSIRE